MIYILDTEQNMIGSLSNEVPNATHYYDDLHSVQIAQGNERVFSETLSLKVSGLSEEADMLVRGNHLLYLDESGKYKLFAIEETSESINGETHTKSVDVAYNAFLTDMRNYTYVAEEKKFYPAKTDEIIRFICTGSTWNIGEVGNLYIGAAKTFVVPEGNALAAMDEFTKTFGLEVEAYVEVNGGQVVDKHVEFKTNTGEDTSTSRFEYRRDLLGATRKATNNDFATMLFPYGLPDKNGKARGIESVNKLVNPLDGKIENLPFIYDEEANDRYNAGRPFIKKKIVSDVFGTPESILSWAKKELKYYNHPKYEYEIDIALFNNSPSLGDRVEIVDFEMSPALTIAARVIQVDYSLSNPAARKVVLGEFKEIEVKPINSILALQDRIDAVSKATKKNYTIDEFVDIQEDKANLKVVVKEDGLRMDLEAAAYTWKRFDANTNELDESFSANGNTIQVLMSDYDKFSYYCDVFVEDFQYIERADFKKGLSAFVKKANKYINEDTVVFAFITDTHYDNDSIAKPTGSHLHTSFERALDYQKVMVELSKQVKLDAIVHGGDVFDGRKKDIDLAKINLDSAIAVFKDADAPKIIARGNHDTNYLFYTHGGKFADRFNPDKVLKNEEAYNIFTQFWDEDNIKTDDNKNAVYGFYDVPNKNTRFILLDPFDLSEQLTQEGRRKYIVRHQYAYSAKQLQWLADTLAETPAGTDIIVVNHMVLTRPTKATDEEINKQLVIDILNKWRTGGVGSFVSTREDYEVNITKDFGKPAQGNLIANIGGHNHKDTAERDKLFNGIIPTVTRASAFAGSTEVQQAERPLDTLQETAFDLVVINKINTSIRFLRYGFGSDKVINYTGLSEITEDNPNIDEGDFENDYIV